MCVYADENSNNNSNNEDTVNVGEMSAPMEVPPSPSLRKEWSGVSLESNASLMSNGRTSPIDKSARAMSPKVMQAKLKQRQNEVRQRVTGDIYCSIC